MKALKTALAPGTIGCGSQMHDDVSMQHRPTQGEG
jgi:hypothetical protein